MNSIKSLELTKILEQLADLTCCDYARNIALSIKPNTNLSFINDELLKTNDALYLSLNYGSPSFNKLLDPTESLKLALVGATLSPSKIINIGAILRQSRTLLDWYSSCAKKTSLICIFERLYTNKILERRISDVLISEEEISDAASDELFNIRRKIRMSESKVRENLDKMLRSSSVQKMLQENIITMRDGRFVLPVKAEYKGSIAGLIHDTSSSGATLFVEPMSVVELNNDIRVLHTKERDEIEKILLELSQQCAEISEYIDDCFMVIISLNLYFAKALIAINMNATMPYINTDGKIKLRKARHPLIDKTKVVPIDLELGLSFSTLVITGPNTGGKTVALKTLGLLTLMTMCGLLIPVAEESSIAIFDNIFVDIGDEQSIAQSLSTFSSHLTNIVQIINNVSNRSLVLVDELGSGTDPVEGAALAISILEKFRRSGALVMATTHYSELKIYALQTENVQNACCEFDVTTLKPTYRLLIGMPGRSNAFLISRKLGLAEDVLTYANTLIASDKKSFEDVIDSLENARQDYENKSSELTLQQNSLADLEQQVKRKNSDILREKEQIIEKARLEAQRIVSNCKADSALIMDELDKLKRQADTANFNLAKSSIKNKLDKLYDNANPVTANSNEGYILPRKLKVGDTVLIVDIDKEATVMEVAKNGRILVQAGIIKSRVELSNLRLVTKSKTTMKGGFTKTVTSNGTAKPSVELDLRGQSVEEALMELDMFLSNATMSNISLITIIHGKGTGALRSAVHMALKKCKLVKSFRLGVYGEGESGVTIAELK